MKFVDTNIFIYSLLAEQDAAKHTKAVELLSSEDVVLSTQVVNELVSVLRSKSQLKDDKLRLLVEDLYLRFSISTVGREDILLAFELRQEHRLSYWDSLIVASALLSRASELYSEDLQDGLVVRSTLRITNPFASAMKV